MSVIKILIPVYTLPNVTTINTLFFENLFPSLQKKVDLHVIWLVYQPDQILQFQNLTENEMIIDIHDYDNAVEILKKHTPDLIFVSATRSFIDYAFSIAAKFVDIPTFSMFWSNWYFLKSSKSNYIMLNIKRFFQNSIPTDTIQNKKKIMRRGRFYIYKYFFLLKTQIAIKINLFQIIRNFFILLKHTLLNTETDSRFQTTIHFLEDKKLEKMLIAAGFDISTLIVTGNPIFDKALQKSLEPKNLIGKSDKKRILLAPSTHYEHGFWSQEQRNFAIKETVNQIHQKNNELSLTVKIHPSTSILSEYESIIHQIDSSIPVYQKGNIQEYLENTDLVITFQSSTAEIYAVIAKKPIIICNFFQSEKDTLVEKGVAIECTKPSNLLKIIENITYDLEYEKKRDNFINEFLYKADGRSSERICDKLLNLVKK